MGRTTALEFETLFIDPVIGVGMVANRWYKVRVWRIGRWIRESAVAD
jgi:hypothetical protein